jgi:hypothetical protein
MPLCPLAGPERKHAGSVRSVAGSFVRSRSCRVPEVRLRVALLDVDLRQHLVIAEGEAEQRGGGDRYALGAQPATLNPYSHGGSQGFKSPHLHPTQPWSPAWRVASVRPAPVQIPLPGSKRAATANETANRYSIAATRRSEATRTRLLGLPITSRFPTVQRVALSAVLPGQVRCAVRLMPFRRAEWCVVEWPRE